MICLMCFSFLLRIFMASFIISQSVRLWRLLLITPAISLTSSRHECDLFLHRRHLLDLRTRNIAKQNSYFSLNGARVSYSRFETQKRRLKMTYFSWLHCFSSDHDVEPTCISNSSCMLTYDGIQSVAYWRDAIRSLHLLKWFPYTCALCQRLYCSWSGLRHDQQFCKGV